MNQPILISLTPAAFAARKQKLVAQGAALALSDGNGALDGNSGTLSHYGVTVVCCYNGVDTLTITVMHKPFIVSEGFVENKIREWFAEEEKQS